ncbi:putative transcription factor C2H2 family [Helianthus debilis subsp. tardiflorus]
MASRKRKIQNDADNTNALHKEWDEISCPICMDHPHNAVLILCSSHSKGCRSFICDTSYRHSNCLDRFKKLVSETTSSTTDPPNLIPANDNLIEDVDLAGGPQDSDHNNNNNNNNNDDAPSLKSKSCLKCPLCRGKVSGWEVVEEVRQYLNSKSRSCSQESCLFSGSYRELRRHARRAHPTARPSDVDPTRERAWRRLEHQREYGDIVSAIRSAMPGAVVFGDYAIENGDNRIPGENRSLVAEAGSNNGHWWTAFFLFQMIGSMEHPPADRRGIGRARVPTRHRRRRLLWGETLLGLQDDDDGDDDSDDGDPFELDLVDNNDEDRVPSENPRRRRRRLTRYRSDEDQS